MKNDDIQSCMIDYPNFPSYPQTVPNQYCEIKKIKRITRTIEKYNKKGNLIGKEVITEEEEIIDVPIWVNTWTSCDGTGDLPNIDNHTIQYQVNKDCVGISSSAVIL